MLFAYAKRLRPARAPQGGCSAMLTCLSKRQASMSGVLMAT